MATEIKYPVRVGEYYTDIIDINDVIIIQLKHTLDYSPNEIVKRRDEIIAALNGYAAAVKALNLIRNDCANESRTHRDRAYKILDDLGELEDD